MTISGSDVETYLDTHPDFAKDYFQNRANLSWINKWLIQHGYQPLLDNLQATYDTRSESRSHPGSGCPSPGPSPTPDCRSSELGFFSDREGGSSNGSTRHRRNNSKKFLRNDFAKARSKSMFRTHEPSFDSERANKVADRRNSLKGMRQFYSLPPTSATLLSMLIQSKVRLPRYESKDEVLKLELKRANEKDFLLEIVKDISHDLELKSLASRIVLNISLLLSAEKSSLFFVEGPKGKQVLVSKLFDLCVGTSCYHSSFGDNAVTIPWGEGLIGHVAQSGETLNLTNVSEDPRYKKHWDKHNVQKTESLLCMAVCNHDNEVIAVAQAVNSKTGRFSKDDEKLLEMYLTFCGLAISNAQALESYGREYDRNKALLEVVHDLFREQTSVETIVTRIMKRAQSLLRCDRCMVILKPTTDSASGKTESSRIFDLHSSKRNGDNMESVNLETYLAKIDKDDCSGVQQKNVLCKRIRDNRCQTLGVAQLMNKEGGGLFDEHDDQLFEVFCIFCGLGINNCQLYDEVSKMAATQAVALEPKLQFCMFDEGKVILSQLAFINEQRAIQRQIIQSSSGVLSYHATVHIEEVFRIKEKNIPECKLWKLDSFDFSDFSLTSDEMLLAAIRIFKDSGLLEPFQIEYQTLVRWLLTVRKNYRNVAYHNWRHAFNVLQFMFVLLKTGNFAQNLSASERLALLVACICHDLDHRGTNNAFQQKSWSPLAQLYGTQATLEQHHFNHAVIILNSEGHNIFSSLGSSEYSHMMKLLKHAILATDLSKHVQVRQKFFPLVESKLYSWDDSEQKELLSSILMTTCDIATITKPWDIQRKAAELVVTEFFNQGDKEKTLLKMQPIALMDRDKQDELPRLQMEWIDGICLPLYKCIAKLDKQLIPLLERVLDNKGHWDILDRKRLENSMKQEQYTIQETDL